MLHEPRLRNWLRKSMRATIKSYRWMKSFMGTCYGSFLTYLIIWALKSSLFFFVGWFHSDLFFPSSLDLSRWRMRLCVVRSALLQKLEVMRRLNICTAFFFVPRSQEINENDTFSLQSCKFRWSRWPTRMRNCQSSRHKNHFDPSVQLHSLRIRTSSCRPVSQKKKLFFTPKNVLLR